MCVRETERETEIYARNVRERERENLCSKMLEGERDDRNVRERGRERALCSKCGFFSFFLSTFSLLSVSENKTSGNTNAGQSVRLCVEIAGFLTKHTVVLQSVTRTCVSDSVVPEF